jgi:PAS domain S-box-containing protein
MNDHNQGIGLFTYDSLRSQLSSTELLRLSTVTDGITPAVHALPTATLAELTHLMVANRASAVVIVEEQSLDAAGQEDSLQRSDSPKLIPIGIVTEQDIVQSLALELELTGIQAQTIMGMPVMITGVHGSLWDVQQMMSQYTQQVIITDQDGHLIGIVTQSSLASVLNPIALYRLAERLMHERSLVLRTQVEREHLLSQIATHVRAFLQLSDVLDMAVTEVRAFLQCDRLIIYQFQPDWSGIIVAESVGDGWSRSLGNRIVDSCFQAQTANLYAEGRMIAVNDIHTAGYSDCHLQLLEQYQVKANLVVPILVEGHLWGLLIGHHCADYRSWHDSDLTLLNEIGVQLAIAIRQATIHQQFQEELHARQDIEATLRQSEAELQSLFAAMDDVVLVLDRQGIYLNVPSSHSSRLYRPSEELLGRSLHDFFSTEQTEFFLRQIEQVLATQQTQEFEYSLIINGTERWFNAKCSPLTSETVLWVARDISDRKATETMLRQYERVVSATTDELALVDRNYIYQLVNQVYLDWHEKTWSEIVGHSVAELLGETAFETVVKPYLDRCLTGENQQYEAWFTYPNGKQRFAKITYSPYVELDGTITGVVASVYDLTAIKRAEQRLELQAIILEQIAKAEPLPAILDALLNAIEFCLGDALCSIMLSDPDGRLRSMPAPHLPATYLQAIDGLVISEEAGSWGVAAFRQEAVIVSDIATDPLWQNYRDLALANGLKACWSLPILASDGRVLGVFGVYYRDCRTPQSQELAHVTRAARIAGIAIEREQTAQSLHQLNQDLERRVEERTAALQSSEERWQLALQGSNDGIWDWDIKTGKVFFSERWKAIRGYAANEVSDTLEEWSGRIHPDDYTAVMAVLDEHFAGITEFFEVEYRVRCKDGSYLWILDRGKALRDAAGQVIRMAGSETDITQRKLAESALRESERRYATLAAAAPVAISRFDTTPLNCVYVNDRWSAMTGRPKESALGFGWIDALHPDERDDLLEQWHAGIVQSTPEYTVINCTEGRHLRPDGSINWYYVQIAPEIDATGAVIGYIGTLTDITDRKQAEIRLQQQADRDRLTNAIAQRIRASLNLQDILNTTVSEVHQVLQTDRVLVYQLPLDSTNIVIAESISPGWMALLHRTFPEEVCLQENYDSYVQGRTFVLSDRETTAISDCFRDFLQALQVRAELVVPILQQERLWGLLVAQQCDLPRQWQPWEIELLQQLSGQLAIAIQQSELYAQLQASHHQLTLINTELAQATRLKDAFLANMSHELRTPLTAILGMSEVLKEEMFGELNPKQHQYVEIIHNSGKHLLMLINDILDVSKIAAGKLELNITPVSVHQLCTASLSMVEQEAAKKDIQLTLTSPPHLKTIYVDERRLCQVLINLLNNAVKFTPTGGQVTLNVSIQYPEDETVEWRNTVPSPAPENQDHQTIFTENTGIVFSVTDTGIGIASEDQSKLFQPFVQIDNNLNRRYEGTGLGLTLVKQIVEMHGGSVSLTSQIGQGSCFRIWLPYPDLNEAIAPPPPSSLPESSPPTLTAPPDSPTLQVADDAPLILIAEDNQDNIDTLSSYLETQGYRLMIAPTGTDAIALAQAHLPALILMDIQMPGVDGLEAIRTIRQIPQLAEIPIIALTALVMESDRDRCLAAGATDYLSKPFKLKQLRTLIQRLLGKIA